MLGFLVWGNGKARNTLPDPQNTAYFPRIRGTDPSVNTVSPSTVHGKNKKRKKQGTRGANGKDRRRSRLPGNPNGSATELAMRMGVACLETAHAISNSFVRPA